jgi:hypothetical protein
MKKTNGLSALACAIGLVASPADAAIIGYSTNVGVSDAILASAEGSYSVNLLNLQLLSLPRFAASLGTLQAAEVFLQGSWTGFTLVQAWDTSVEADSSLFPPFIVNERNDAAISLLLETSLRFELFDPDGPVVNIGLPDVTNGCSDTTRDIIGVTECLRYAIDDVSLTRTLNLGSLPLSSFVGTDPLNLSMLLTGRVSGYCDDDDRGDNCSIDVYSGFTGVAGVRYTYSTPGDDGEGGVGGGGGNPVAVPEPGSFGLLAMGLLGLACRSRRPLRPAAIRGER